MFCLHNTSRSPNNGLQSNALQCEGMLALRYLLSMSISANLSKNCAGHSYSLTAIDRRIGTQENRDSGIS